MKKKPKLASGARISQTGKMPCLSWSLPARVTCPGSRDSNGQILDVCLACYACLGRYAQSNVKLPRQANMKAWQHPQFVGDMISVLAGQDYFRWFDSGDIYCEELADKIYKIIKGTPRTKHWLPTKSYSVSQILPILEKIKGLPNVKVRYSSGSVLGEYVQGLHGSTCVPADSVGQVDGVTMCQATKTGCGPCRQCWSDVKVIGYIGHGAAINRVIKQARARKMEVGNEA